MVKIAQALTIAGSDCSGGAGIQADIKTFQMRRVFGMSVIAALTAQNTLGVYGIHAVPTDFIRAQMDAIAADFQVGACKIGMLGTAAITECVAEALRVHDFGKIVLDPVMIAKGGAPLLEAEAISALKTHLLPLADVITPNLPETEALTGIAVHDEQTARAAAQKLQDYGVRHVVIKGGHSSEALCRDWVFSPDGDFDLDAPRIDTRHTHGTGCTFSACLAAELAKGRSIAEAARTAKAFISAAIREALQLGQGHGPTNHWAYQDE